MKEFDFTSLLCSRLCHDLVSPIGSINNGVEILQDETDPDMREQVMDLLRQSAEQTSNKIKFFRMAFGAAGGFGSMLDLNEAKSAIESLFAFGALKTEFDFDTASGPKDPVKLLLNMALVLGESVVGAGLMKVSFKEEGSNFVLSVRAQGRKVIVPESVVMALSSGGDLHYAEARVAPALLIAKLCQKLGCQCSLDEVEPEIFELKSIVPQKT